MYDVRVGWNGCTLQDGRIENNLRRIISICVILINDNNGGTPL